jgi:hypothetical protein
MRKWLWTTAALQLILFSDLYPSLCEASDKVDKSKAGADSALHYWKLGSLPNPKEDDGICSKHTEKSPSICDPDAFLSR